MSSFQERLAKFLYEENQPAEFEHLSQDASTREYFRITWQNSSAIACVYPEPFSAAEHSYIDVTELFLKCGLPVAEIFSIREDLGLMVLEDFGDRILRDELLASDEHDRNELIDRAIKLIPRIQAATETAFETDSVVSRLSFDIEKLSWELDFFKTHYFGTFKKHPLSEADDQSIAAEFKEIAAELSGKAVVVCHRDFHAANLMLDSGNELRIIDHQDARLGSVTYDLVSLLLDRVTEPPSDEWLEWKKAVFFNERDRLGFAELDRAEFEQEFRLQTIQRCLKAVGTFSFQSANRGKTYFLPFIGPLFRIVVNAIDDLGRFPNLRRILTEQI
jgi:aminoglycoside/choline kinase family phosphotransferase